MERTDEDSDADSDELQDEINESEEERMKKFSKFNFSGMSFKDYVGNIRGSNLNREMTQLVATFTK